jgi:hypothetical protein
MKLPVASSRELSMIKGTVMNRSDLLEALSKETEFNMRGGRHDR